MKKKTAKKKKLTRKQKGKLQMIAGVAGMIAAACGYLYARTLQGSKKRFVIILSGVLFLGSLYMTFTGYKNYATIMMGHNAIPAGNYFDPTKNDFMKLTEVVIARKVPMIVAKNREELREIMEKRGKYYLWLPCAKGGKLYKQSAFLYTRFNLPDKDVTCPTGRKAIEYTDG